MSWILQFQWPAGVALIIFGIVTWADGIEPYAGRRLSAAMERSAPNSPYRLFLGILAGIALHGKRGFQYCKRRYLAGLLSSVGMAVFSLGMAIGIFIPATLMLYMPYFGAFPLLVVGMAIQLSSRAPTMRQFGQALLGLGCCWIGYTACRNATPPEHIIPYALLGATLVAVITHTPVAAFLAVASTLPPHFNHMHILLGTASILAVSWLMALARTLAKSIPPFTPALSLLSTFDLLFPERALQAALQENRRMAIGLSKAARALVTYKNENTYVSETKQLVEDVEHAMDEFKPAAQNYLLQLTRHKLEERQVRLSMFLFINIGDLERISDHLLAVVQNLPPPARRADYPEPLLQGLDTIVEKTAEIIDALAQSITGNRGRKVNLTGSVGEARDEALELIDHFTAILQDLILNNEIKPSRAIRMQNLRSHFERLIRHARAIAVSVAQEDFWIEPDIIHERAKPLSKYRTKDHLTRTQMNDLLQEPKR